MTEPKYPRVYGFWVDRLQRFTDDMRTNRDDAESESNSDETVVELIPLPEHQSIVAAAVAAAVERCAGILEDGARCDELSGFHGKAVVFREFANRIREVPK